LDYLKIILAQQKNYHFPKDIVVTGVGPYEEEKNSTVQNFQLSKKDTF